LNIQILIFSTALEEYNSYSALDVKRYLSSKFGLPLPADMWDEKIKSDGDKLISVLVAKQESQPITPLRGIGNMQQASLETKEDKIDKRIIRSDAIDSYLRAKDGLPPQSNANEINNSLKKYNEHHGTSNSEINNIVNNKPASKIVSDRIQTKLIHTISSNENFYPTRKENSGSQTKSKTKPNIHAHDHVDASKNKNESTDEMDPKLFEKTMCNGHIDPFKGFILNIIFTCVTHLLYCFQDNQ
jgi:hypothetical protein